MRRLLAVLVVTMLVYPVTVRAQASCDKCEHLCMWAPLVTSAEKTKLLYENANVVFGDDAKDVKGLEQDVNGTMLEWKTTSDAESPCYQIILKEYLGGDDPNVILPDTAELDRVITHLPPSGNLFHVAYDKRGCPIEDNQGKPFDRKKLENQMCPALVDAFLEHEKVHQNQCLELWKTGGRKAAVAFFTNKSSFAKSEALGYETQVRMMKESMEKLIKQKGCQVSTYSIGDFSPPPSKADLDNAWQKARPKIMKLNEALKKINEYNESRRPR